MFALICTTSFTSHQNSFWERKTDYRRNCPATTLTNLLTNLKPFTPNQKYFFTCQYVHVYIIRICFRKRLCMHLHIHFFVHMQYFAHNSPVLRQVVNYRFWSSPASGSESTCFGCRWSCGYHSPFPWMSETPKHVHRKMATAIGKDMQDKSHLKFICPVVFTVITWSLFFCIYRLTTVVLEHRSMLEV